MFTEKIVRGDPSLVGDRMVWIYQVEFWGAVIYNLALENVEPNLVEVRGRSAFLSKMMRVFENEGWE